MLRFVKAFITTSVDYNNLLGSDKCPIKCAVARTFNNYSPQARCLSGNIHRDEVEVNIPR